MKGQAERIAAGDLENPVFTTDTDEVGIVTNSIGKMTVDLINEAVKNGTYENMTVRTELKERISRYVLRETGKHPMILPAIIEININR